MIQININSLLRIFTHWRLRTRTLPTLSEAGAPPRSEAIETHNNIIFKV